MVSERILDRASVLSFLPLFQSDYWFSKVKHVTRNNVNKHKFKCSEELLLSLGWKYINKSCKKNAKEHIVDLKALITYASKYLSMTRRISSRTKRSIVQAIYCQVGIEDFFRIGARVLGRRRYTINCLLLRLPLKTHKRVVEYLEVANDCWQAWSKLREILFESKSKPGREVSELQGQSEEKEAEDQYKRSFEQYLVDRRVKENTRAIAQNMSCQAESIAKLAENMELKTRGTRSEWSLRVKHYMRILRPNPSILLDTSTNRLRFFNDKPKFYPAELKNRCKNLTFLEYLRNAKRPHTDRNSIILTDEFITSLLQNSYESSASCKKKLIKIYRVKRDERTNKNSPCDISGDMTHYLISFNGTQFVKFSWRHLYFLPVLSRQKHSKRKIQNDRAEHYRKTRQCIYRNLASKINNRRNLWKKRQRDRLKEFGGTIIERNEDDMESSRSDSEVSDS